jgi:hypothetical protein
MGIGILNLGGVRKEEVFFGELQSQGIAQAGHHAWQALRREIVRASLPAEDVLPGVVAALRGEIQA